MSKELNKYNEAGHFDGYWEFYHLTGELNAKGYYIDGLANGYWVEYDIDGNITKESNWKNAKRIGKEIIYHNEVDELPINYKKI